MKKLLNKEMAFLAGIAIYILILFANSLALPAKAKIMPIAVGSICLALIVLEAIIMLCSKPKEEKQGKSAETGSEDTGNGAPATIGVTSKKTDETVKRAILYSVWLISFGFSINILGFIVTLAIWLFILLQFASNATLKQSLLITIGTLIFVYIVFVKLLAVRFTAGLLF